MSRLSGQQCGWSLRGAGGIPRVGGGDAGLACSEQVEAVIEDGRLHLHDWRGGKWVKVEDAKPIEDAEFFQRPPKPPKGPGS